MTAAPTLRVYVASALGLTVPGRIFYSRTLLPALRANALAVLDPWAADALTGEAQGAERMGRRNEQLLRSATALFAVLDGPDADAGTAADVGFAAALGKPIVAWRSDARLAGPDSEGPLSPSLVWMVNMNGGGLHTDLGSAISALVALAASR